MGEKIDEYAHGGSVVRDCECVDGRENDSCGTEQDVEDVNARTALPENDFEALN